MADLLSCSKKETPGPSFWGSPKQWKVEGVLRKSSYDHLNHKLKESWTHSLGLNGVGMLTGPTWTVHPLKSTGCC